MMVESWTSIPYRSGFAQNLRVVESALDLRWRLQIASRVCVPLSRRWRTPDSRAHALCAMNGWSDHSVSGGSSGSRQPGALLPASAPARQDLSTCSRLRNQGVPPRPDRRSRYHRRSPWPSQHGRSTGSKPRSDGPDGALDMPRSKRRARSDINRPDATCHGPAESIGIDRSGIAGDPAAGTAVLIGRASTGAPQPTARGKCGGTATRISPVPYATTPAPRMANRWSAVRSIRQPGVRVASETEDRERLSLVRTSSRKWAHEAFARQTASVAASILEVRCLRQSPPAGKCAGTHFRGDAGAKNPVCAAFPRKPCEFRTLGTSFKDHDGVRHALAADGFRSDDAVRPSGAMHDDHGIRVQPVRKTRFQFGIGAARQTGNR